MHGNVAERCRDYYSEKLPGGRDPETTERDPATIEVYRVIRGGCWNDKAEQCRSAARREKVFESARGNCGGFRVALTPARGSK
jgi:formylglycine-generating enzyme required for sulfatase activity